MPELSKKNVSIGVAALLGLSLICFLSVAFLVFRNFAIYIEPDKRGVVLSPYEPSGEILEPGLHVISFGERVEIIDISPQTYNMSAPDSIDAITLDGKKVLVDVSLIYALNPNKILDMYTTWRDRYQDNVVRPLSRSTTREIVSNYDLVDFDTQRSEVERVIFDALNTRFTENDLILMKFSIISIQQAK